LHPFLRKYGRQKSKTNGSYPLCVDDINRSHIIGTINNGKGQLICRFKNWKIKNAIYMSKKSRVGRSGLFFFFFLLSTKPEIVVPGSGIQITPPLCVDDINRSHIIGTINNGKGQLICRFKNWKIKNAIYMLKKNLKNNPEKIFITEDLTKTRQFIGSR
jgi:hypothetical protein